MENENVTGYRPADAESTEAPQPHVLESKSSQVFEKTIGMPQEATSPGEGRQISTPLPETSLPAKEAAVCNVAEPILLPGSQPRRSLHFEPISNLRNDPVQKERFLLQLEKWFDYEPPPYEKMVQPQPTTRGGRRVGLFERARRDALQGRLETAKSDTMYAIEFARLTKNILNNKLPEFDRKTLQDNFPGSTDFLTLLHGVYDSQGNLQAIAIAGEKGKSFWVDRLANAPWNITRSLRRDLEQNNENAKLDSYLAQMPDDSRVKTGWGAATSLMQHLAKTTKELGCNRISLQPTGTSEPFYEKLGFTDRGWQHCSAIDVSSDPESAYMCLIDSRQRQQL